MNDVDFPYVVLRNFDNLPHDVQVGEHSDLDLLVYDLDHWMELYPMGERIHPAPRVRFKVPIGNTFFYTDVRYIGDDYYPKHFEENILSTREWNEKGFYTPNPIHFRLALAYHAVHHKNENTYQNKIGNGTIEDYLKALKESNIGWVKPKDHTVGRFHPYWKGATAVVSKEDGIITKRQNSWDQYNLIENEERILRKIKSKHFPKVIRSAGKGFNTEEIQLEDCGELLTIQNIPDNWAKQLVQIMEDLKKNAVQHRDIKPDNLMVKDGVIKLIDFGWARFKDDPDDNPPNCLGYPYKPSYGFDDNFSMRTVAKEIGYKLCESLQLKETNPAVTTTE